MDKFRQNILPVLVAIVLVIALVYRLASCSPGSTKNGSTPFVESSASPAASISPGPEATPSPGAVRPTAPYSNDEIKSVYTGLGLSVVEIRDAGDATMVHYYSPTGVAGEIISRFDWFDRSTGARDLVYGWAYTDKFEIKADKSFTVLTTGLSYVDGRFSFPALFRSSYTNIDGAVKFTGSEEKYYAPLANSYTVGVDRHECLTSINFNTGMVSLGFGVQHGYEGEFYTAYESIPKMTVKNEAGFSTITLYKTILADNFKPNYISSIDNAYCRLVKVTTDGNDTTIKLKLTDTVKRYNISTERSPVDNLPYAILEYTVQSADYPAGW